MENGEEEDAGSSVAIGLSDPDGFERSCCDEDPRSVRRRQRKTKACRGTGGREAELRLKDDNARHTAFNEHPTLKASGRESACLQVIVLDQLKHAVSETVNETEQNTLEPSNNFVIGDFIVG